MTEPRLASAVQVSAFIRLANSQGDFATVLHKGDAVGGAIMLIGMVRGENAKLFERYPSLDGASAWLEMQTTNDVALTEYWKKRIIFDRDLWVLELDVASSERLDGLLGVKS